MGLFSKDDCYTAEDFLDYDMRLSVYCSFLYGYKELVEKGKKIALDEYFDGKYSKKEPEAARIIRERFIGELNEFIGEHGYKSTDELAVLTAQLMYERSTKIFNQMRI